MPAAPTGRPVMKPAFARLPSSPIEKPVMRWIPSVRL
jgi:hypothetical protein